MGGCGAFWAYRSPWLEPVSLRPRPSGGRGWGSMPPGIGLKAPRSGAGTLDSNKIRGVDAPMIGLLQPSLGGGWCLGTKKVIEGRCPEDRAPGPAPGSRSPAGSGTSWRHLHPTQDADALLLRPPARARGDPHPATRDTKNVALLLERVWARRSPWRGSLFEAV